MHRETVGRYLHPPEPVSKPAIPPTGSEVGLDPKPAIVPTGFRTGRTSQRAPLTPVIQQGLLAGTVSTAHLPGGIRPVDAFI
jgi:hypothetical protein